MKVFRVLDFSEPFSEEDIALQSDLEPDKSEFSHICIDEMEYLRRMH